VHTIVDWAQVVGAFAALAAIWFARGAHQETNRVRREAIDERGRLFELEILREILREVDDGLLFKIAADPWRLRRFRWRIDFLPKSELSFWRELMDLEWQDEVSARVGFKEAWMAKSVEIFESAKRGEGLPEPDKAAWRLDHAQLAQDVSGIAFTFHETVSMQLLRELMGAIAERVEAGRYEPRRRSWLGWRRRPVGPA
jgi:hypothetical protein